MVRSFLTEGKGDGRGREASCASCAEGHALTCCDHRVHHLPPQAGPFPSLLPPASIKKSFKKKEKRLIFDFLDVCGRKKGAAQAFGGILTAKENRDDIP